MDTNEQVPVGQVLVAPGDRCPRDAFTRPRSPFRAGDLLQVSCPFTETEVTGVFPSPMEVVVRWPWGQVDPDSQYLWSGEVAFEVGQESWWPFEVTPPLARLRPGDRCRIGIPPRVAQVALVQCWWPDHDTGQLPRVPLRLWVLPQGVPHDLGQERVHQLDPYGAEPIRVELLYRPYLFLQDLDQVVDRHGRRWEFCTPYWWVELDRDDQRDGLPPPLPGPAWPLRLLANRQLAAPDPGRAEQVQRATASGDHASHLARWSRLAGADPVAAEDQGTPPDDGHPALDSTTWVTEAAKARASLRGLTFSQILRAFVHAWDQRAQSYRFDDDSIAVPKVERVQLHLAEMTSALCQLRASQATGPSS